MTDVSSSPAQLRRSPRHRRGDDDASSPSLGANIVESNQFWDRQTNRFFMRSPSPFRTASARTTSNAALKPVVDRFGMKATLVDRARAAIIIMVSKFDHAMLHLLYQIKVGWLDAEVAAIVSNHETARPVADLNGIPFHYWPVTLGQQGGTGGKAAAARARTAVPTSSCLRATCRCCPTALSKRLVRQDDQYPPFLPARFKGAQPYLQAHERGVKLIGATAHYVTPDLDEGPIIEQETERVSHAMSAADFVAVGRDIEAACWRGPSSITWKAAS